ncbi:hypothetical protein WN944_016035 [Citrus x changshan-huyou]|uniref:Uncharacterized protein n=1 Tax=Citrus x changshan-huyou TaxID=2935761 RepID=A0AAP0M8M0_9ROSI
MAGVMYSLVDKIVKRWGSVPIRGFNQMTITSKLESDCLQVLLDMASRLIKKSQKLEILPVKHQPNFGSIIEETGGDDHLTQVHPQGHDSVATAGNHLPDVGSTGFSGRPSGRGQSSLDTCSDGLHTQGHDSAATAGTFGLPSPAFNDKSSVADQGHYQKSENSDILLTTTFESGPHGEQRFQDGGGDYHVIQVDHPSHDSATFGSTAASNSSSAVADQKPYKNLVGSTAFRSKTSCGEQSSPGGGDEDLVIEGNDSAATAGSPEQASPAVNNTPSASDQSVSPPALLENRDDGERPPPDRSASNMGTEVNPSAERRLNPASVAKICLLFSCEVSIAPSQIRYNAGTSLSSNANILYLFAELLGVVGFLLCFGAYICQHRGRASVVMTVMGGVATICGLLSILGTRFPEKSMLWCTAAICALPISASPFAVRELIRSI